jgi:hypothetical protein
MTKDELELEIRKRIKDDTKRRDIYLRSSFEFDRALANYYTGRIDADMMTLSNLKQFGV